MKKIVLILLLFSIAGCFTPKQHYKYLNDSVVRIEYNGRHIGSGFVVDSSGLIITAKHVVKREGDYEIVFANGSRYCVKKIKASKISDCAVLSISGEFFPILRMTTKVYAGEPVIVIGSPLTAKFFNYITAGIVSKINVRIEAFSTAPLIMIDAATNPGNSGGPVLNWRGEVIGIVVAMNSQGVGMSLAVSSVDLITLLRELEDEDFNQNERVKEIEE